MCFASNAQRLSAMISLKSSPRSSFARSSSREIVRIGSVPRAAVGRGWSIAGPSIARRVITSPLASHTGHHRPMDMDLVEFAGWPDCIRLSDGAIELIVTTRVGPRIISARRGDGENLLWVDPETAGQTGGDEWRSYGGQRLWLAPETLERTYVPDNEPVD